MKNCYKCPYNGKKDEHCIQCVKEDNDDIFFAPYVSLESSSLDEEGGFTDDHIVLSALMDDDRHIVGAYSSQVQPYDHLIKEEEEDEEETSVLPPVDSLGLPTGVLDFCEKMSSLPSVAQKVLMVLLTSKNEECSNSKIAHKLGLSYTPVWRARTFLESDPFWKSVLRRAGIHPKVKKTKKVWKSQK